MQFAHPHFPQIVTVFGGAYVAEQHGDAMCRNLATPDVDRVVTSLTASMFDEMMKSLRSALSLR